MKILLALAICLSVSYVSYAAFGSPIEAGKSISKTDSFANSFEKKKKKKKKSHHHHYRSWADDMEASLK